VTSDHLLHDLGGAVAAAVVHDDHLVRLGAAVEVRDHRIEVARKTEGLVVSGNDDRPGDRHDNAAGSGRPRRRAIPVSWAARATPPATPGAAFSFKTLGGMYSPDSSPPATHAGHARAAAAFTSAVERPPRR